MQAVLKKADVRGYVSGDAVKPERGESAETIGAERVWIKTDQKAKSGIILSISTSEIKQVKKWRRPEERG